MLKNINQSKTEIGSNEVINDLKKTDASFSSKIKRNKWWLSLISVLLLVFIIWRCQILIGFRRLTGINLISYCASSQAFKLGDLFAGLSKNGVSNSIVVTNSDGSMSSVSTDLNGNFVVTNLPFPSLTGPTGVPGADGLDGFSTIVTGPAGPIGPQGNSGAQGNSGSNGTNGTNGSNGSNGLPGVAGAVGPMGPAGPLVLTNTLVNDGINTLTSTVNGLSDSDPIVNTNVLGLAGNNLNSTVNGVVSNILDLSTINPDCVLTGPFFCQDGNTFGTTAVLGTQDNNDLRFITNNIQTGLISADGLAIYFGNGAGAGGSLVNTNFIGVNAGNGASGADNSNFMGLNAGNLATGASNSNFIGTSAGNGASNAFFSNFVGNNAGIGATDANLSNFMGFNAGANAINADGANFIGFAAGNGATNASQGVFIGFAAGGLATNASSSVFIGGSTGESSVNASSSVFIGNSTGFTATNAARSIFIGQNAGFFDTVDNTVSGSSILIGNSTNTGGFSNSIALGENAINTASNQLTIGGGTNPIDSINEMRLGQNDTNTFPLIFSNLTGTGLGTSTPNAQLTVAGTGAGGNAGIQWDGVATAPSLSSISAGRIYFNSTSNLFECSTNAGAYSPCINNGTLISADNGLTVNPAGNVQLGGTLIQNTTITNNGFTLLVNGTGNAGGKVATFAGDVDIQGVIDPTALLFSDSGVGSYNPATTGGYKISVATSGPQRPIYVSPLSDTTTAFQIRQASGLVATTFFDADAQNQRIGVRTVAPEFELDLSVDGGIISRGTFGSGAVLTTTGAGVRLLWSPRRGAFRAGRASGTSMDNANIGDYSAAFGETNTASGVDSFATGNNNTASGFYSTAFGVTNTASGDMSFVTGNGNTTSNTQSTSFGSLNNSTGVRSMTWGTQNVSSGQDSSSFGTLNTASGSRSVAFGAQNTASGIASFAHGTLTQAIGNDSTTFGQSTIANGIRSIATGSLSTANGLTSFVGGSSSSTGLLANDSFAYGTGVSTTGSGSTAFGLTTVAQGFGQFAIGSKNIASGTNTSFLASKTANENAFIIGNGTVGNSNAFSVTWQGNSYQAGALSMTGATSVPAPAVGNGHFYYDATLNKFQCSENGVAYFDCFAAVGGVNIYNTDGNLTGDRTLTNGGFEFVIDGTVPPPSGKTLTVVGDMSVTGVIDPTALLFSDNAPSSYDPSLTNGYKIGHNGASTRSIFVSTSSDQTDAFQVRKSDDTTVILNVDNLNEAVGIGTSTPSEILHIFKDQNTGTISLIQNPNAGATAYSAYNLQNDSGAISGLFDFSTNFVLPTLTDTFSLISSNSNGINISSTSLSGSLNFYTTGFSAADLRLALQADGALSFIGQTVAPAVSGVSNGNMYFDTTLGKFQCSENTGVYFDCFSSSMLFSADNGLSVNPAGNVQLGGTLIQNTTVTNNGFDLLFNGTGNGSGKIATFAGDVDIQGVIDPTALLFSDSGVGSYDPVAGNGFRIGVTGATQRPIFVSPMSNTTNIFQIRNAANTAFFTADSVNQRIGIGTSSPTTTLHIDSNQANTSAITTFENTAGDFQIFRSDATPEGSITGSIGDIANNTTGGLPYYKQTGSATNTGWTPFQLGEEPWVKATHPLTLGQEMLYPFDTDVSMVQIAKNDANTLTGFRAVNTEEASNYAGAVLELKGSGLDYTNNMYVGKYSANYYVPSWAGNGVVATDKDLILGAVTTGTSDIIFQTGGGYAFPPGPTFRMILDSSGNLGLNDQTPDGLFDIDSTATSGVNIGLTNTGVYTGTGLVNITANSATTGTVMTMNANSLSSGVGLNLSSTGTGLTGSLLNISSSTNNNTTNGVARLNIASNLHSGYGMYITDNGNTSTSLFAEGNKTTGRVIHGRTATAHSGAVAYFESASATATGEALSVSSLSTAAVTNGIVRFNFTGAHTGNGFQIDDATVSGSVLKINAPSMTNGIGISYSANAVTSGTLITTSSNSLTSGNGLAMTSTATGFTGSLAYLELSGNNAANTGSLLRLNSIGANTIAKAINVTMASTGNLTNGGVNFNFSGAHTGSGFQIDDATASGTAMAINANYLTTGIALNVSSFADTTGGALVFLNNGGTGSTQPALHVNSSSTSTTSSGTMLFTMANHLADGILVNDQTQTGTVMNINGNQLTTGNGVVINTTNSAMTGKAFSVVTTSTGFTNGGVYFNFFGAHTGTGVLVDDVTTTGTVMKMNMNSLTTGTGLHISNTTTHATADNLLILQGGNDGAAETGNHIQFLRPDGTVIGSVTQNAATTVAYNTTSDARVKSNITDSGRGIADLMKIQVRDYSYNLDPSHKTTTGLIAQELINIVPEAVSTNGDNGTTELSRGASPWGIDYGKLTPLLIKSVQEQQGQIATLKLDVDGLKSNLTISTPDIISPTPTVSDNSGLISIITKAINEFFGNISEFTQNIFFKGRVTFADKDLAGFALIEKGSDNVQIKFTSDYLHEPIVNVTQKSGQAVTYTIEDSSLSGFTIKLSKLAEKDINFNWIAVAIEGATTFKSTKSSTNSIEPTPSNENPTQPTISITPSILPTSPIESTSPTPTIEISSPTMVPISPSITIAP